MVTGKCLFYPSFEFIYYFIKRAMLTHDMIKINWTLVDYQSWKQKLLKKLVILTCIYEVKRKFFSKLRTTLWIRLSWLVSLQYYFFWKLCLWQKPNCDIFFFIEFRRSYMVFKLSEIFCCVNRNNIVKECNLQPNIPTRQWRNVPLPERHSFV